MKRLAGIAIAGAFVFCSSAWGGEDVPKNHEKLKAAMGWLIGEWEVSGEHEEFGKWTMTWLVNWDVDDTVIVWRIKYVAERLAWSTSTTYYWDVSDKTLKSVGFVGDGGHSVGVLKQAGDKRLLWSLSAVRGDGTKRRNEQHFALQESGTLIFQHYIVKDDGQVEERWKFELTKK